MRIRLLLFVAMMTAAGLDPAAAAADSQAYDAATRGAIQSVITRQLDAFRRDDGTAAEAFATPALKTKFPDPAKFMAMVKENYGALIRPKSTTFGEVADSPHGPLQKMTVVADDGTVWTAIYALEKIDGEWRISGCGIQKDEGQQAI